MNLDYSALFLIYFLTFQAKTIFSRLLLVILAATDILVNFSPLPLMQAKIQLVYGDLTLVNLLPKFSPFRFFRSFLPLNLSV